MNIEVGAALLVAAIALPCVTITLVAYRRTRSRRLLIGSLAMGTFLAKGLAMAALGFAGETTPELVELGGDIAGLGLFLASLVVPAGGDVPGA